MSDAESIPTPGESFGEEAAEAAGDMAGAVDGESESIGPMDVLMHTEPDIPVAEAEQTVGGSKAAAHGYVGVRKCLHAVTGAGGGAGMPAIGNFLLGGFHFMTGRTSDEKDENRATVEFTDDGEVYDG